MSTILQEQFINENRMLPVLISSKYRLYRHLFLIVFFCLAMFNSEPEYTEPVETYSRIIAIMMLLVLVYGNMYFLVPRFLFKGRYKIYCLSILGIAIIAALIRNSSEYFYTQDVQLDSFNGNENVYSFSLIIIMVVLASSAIKLFQQWITHMQLINEFKQTQTNAELVQLKNQINPHFLFNMLNNANVLTKKDPEKASQLLVKLSDLLRYQLYDSARDNVLLTSDIHFLEDFLNLEKVRRDSFDFLISKEGNLSGVKIPPLLFISFVENAVKHNNDATKSSYVNLFFDVRNDELFFKCINSKPAHKSINNTGGLGLANIKRRLELLYPATHTLNIEDSSEAYCVTLTIKL